MKLHVLQQELANLRLTRLKVKFDARVEKINMARQKKPNKHYDDSNVVALASTDLTVVENYLKRISFKAAGKHNKHRQIYNFIRDLMYDSLLDKQKKDPLYAALIERIARMTVILDKIEKQIFDGLPDMTEVEITDKLGGNYLKYLKEYRDFIISFSDLRWAGDQIQKSKSVEKVREIVREEVRTDTSQNTQDTIE